jgi:hypothetical protein
MAGPMPRRPEAMKATLTTNVFDDSNWIVERKLDGYRCVAFRDGGPVDLESRNYLSLDQRGGWLDANRNVTFHYPEMHPEKSAHGKEEISNALTAAAELEGTISMEEHFGSVRFEFADTVAVQWVPEEDTSEIVERLREAATALARFVQVAATEYLMSQPKGTYTVE